MLVVELYIEDSTLIEHYRKLVGIIEGQSDNSKRLERLNGIAIKKYAEMIRKKR